MTIKNNEGTVVSETATIAKYFRKEGQTTGEIAGEIKALTAADKTELAIGAAKELGWTVE